MVLSVQLAVKELLKYTITPSAGMRMAPELLALAPFLTISYTVAKMVSAWELPEVSAVTFPVPQQSKTT